MATYTQYYSLDKYESTDRPNLRDQYNAAMDKVDSQLHVQAGNLATAQQAVQTLQTQVTTNTGNISALQGNLALVSATASAAASDAATALLELGGVEIHKIGPTELGTGWTMADASHYSYVDFHAVIIEFPQDEIDSFMIGHLQFHYNGTIPSGESGWQDHGVVALTDWVRGSGVTEALLAPVSGNLPADFRATQPMVGITRQGVIYWTHQDATTSALTSPQMNCSFVFPVSPSA